MNINNAIYHLCAYICKDSTEAKEHQFCSNWGSHDYLGLTFHNEEDFRKWMCSDLHHSLAALSIEVSNMGYSKFINYKFLTPNS